MGEEAAVREGLHRRIALVTGASSGLGRATALALAGAGADVAALARSEPDLERLVEEISALGRKALALPIDLARPEDALSAVERAAEALGAIDILVNSAATDVPGRVADISVESWDRVIGVNLRAPFVLAKAVLPHMQKAGAGHDHQRLLCSRKARLGRGRRLLRLQVRAYRIDPGSGRGGKALRHSGLRPLPRGNGDELGHLVARRSVHPETGRAVNESARSRGRREPHRLDRNRAARARAQRGCRDPAGGRGLAVVDG